jgi:fluoride exporter
MPKTTAMLPFRQFQNRLITRSFSLVRLESSGNFNIRFGARPDFCICRQVPVNPFKAAGADRSGSGRGPDELGILHIVAVFIGGAVGGMARFALTLASSASLARVSPGARWPSMSAARRLIGALAALFPSHEAWRGRRPPWACWSSACSAATPPCRPFRCRPWCWRARATAGRARQCGWPRLGLCLAAAAGFMAPGRSGDGDRLSRHATVGAGAALGSVARFAGRPGRAVLLGPGFAWGTLAANVAGSFLICLYVGTAPPPGPPVNPSISTASWCRFLRRLHHLLDLQPRDAAARRRWERRLLAVYVAASLLLWLAAGWAGFALAGRLTAWVVPAHDQECRGRARGRNPPSPCGMSSGPIFSTPRRRS